MKSTFINVLIFAAGAAIGSAVTWKIVKDRYDKIVQEEIESVRNAFGRQDTETENEEVVSEEEPDEEDAGKYYNIVKDTYTDLLTEYRAEGEGDEELGTDPYVIRPYDFGELEDYHQIELTYYLDDILEDDDHHIVTDAEELIGPEALSTFGHYEEDSVYVRNDRLRTDFLILRDYRTYEEAQKLNPGR